MSTLSPRTRQLVGVLGLLVVLALVWWSRAGDDGGSSRPPQPSPTVHHSSTAEPRTPTSQSTAGGVIAFADLPVEGQRVLQQIDAGGPFAYSRDGITFRNAEGLLPREPSGYYREYTVPTPGSSDRGARRIIGGEEGERYYSADHYRSFRAILR